MTKKNPNSGNNLVAHQPKARIQVKEVPSSSEKLHKDKFEQLLNDAILGIKKK